MHLPVDLGDPILVQVDNSQVLHILESMLPQSADEIPAQIDLGDRGQIGERVLSQFADLSILERDLLQVLQLPQHLCRYVQ